MLSAKLFLTRQEAVALKRQIPTLAKAPLSVTVSEGGALQRPQPMSPPAAFGGISSADMASPMLHLSRKSVGAKPGPACVSLGPRMEQEAAWRQALKVSIKDSEDPITSALCVHPGGSHVHSLLTL